MDQLNSHLKLAFFSRQKLLSSVKSSSGVQFFNTIFKNPDIYTSTLAFQCSQIFKFLLIFIFKPCQTKKLFSKFFARQFSCHAKKLLNMFKSPEKMRAFFRHAARRTSSNLCKEILLLLVRGVNYLSHNRETKFCDKLRKTLLSVWTLKSHS